ncbi:MAG: type I-U CRISPR-associated protein Cas7 [Deltaproteobacteria bacterium]|nr:type I-U CRISPR-associated protein Cas7 [Deltaproteobacteria bacterium]
MSTITYETLRHAIDHAAAIRAVTRLEPAGGPGDKVFPPTYVKERNAQTKYAFERRQIDGRTVDTVLLDSVASQANRMEEALLEGYRRGELAFPLVEVDFSGVEKLEDLDRVTALQAPHRIADALLRDSLLGGVPFRHSDVGRAITDARPNHATAMYQYCPTALVFGCWDSTGPKGGLGSKFQRSLVSEIVGVDAVPGVKTASRIDPAGIQKNAGPVYQSKANKDDWTTIESEASKDGTKLKLFSRTGGEGKDKGSPATINHGNIPPSIDSDAGGVTIDHARQTIVLSLGGLRRLRFQTRTDGKRLDDKLRPAAETAARTALAALALAAVVHQRDNDFDLRSRSVLVAKEPLTFEVLDRNGGPPTRFTLDRAQANALVTQAAKEAEKLGLGWVTTPITMVPAPKLAKLIQVSREQAAAGLADDGTTA